MATQYRNEMFFSPGKYWNRVDEHLRTWNSGDFSGRLWKKDSSIWGFETGQSIRDRLGWLDLPRTMQGKADALKDFAEHVKARGIEHIVLFGMGGSSLAPAVYQRIFGNVSGYPELIVLDSTHPEAVLTVSDRIDIRRSIFIVSSKSGTTVETLSFFRYFWARANEATETPGSHFIAITDPGTPLEKLSTERGFLKVFNAPSDVGGRYSALTVFGLVPAALIGMDVSSLLYNALHMAEACSPGIPAHHNPGLLMGAAMGELAQSGKDKLTFFTSPSLSAFPLWLEQLIAESTGKGGRGLIPVNEEGLVSSDLYGNDRFFIYLHLIDDERNEYTEKLFELEQAGHVVARIVLKNRCNISQEIFRWEMAVSSASAILGVNPFDQPDVQLAKSLAHEAMEKKDDFARQSASQDIETLSIGEPDQLHASLDEWEETKRDGDYVCLQAYLSPGQGITDTLQDIRKTMGTRLACATSLGYGPGFLHSTGQLHKGGPNTGMFLQLVDNPQQHLAIPETEYTFGQLIKAQALGDYHALIQRGRRVLRINVGSNAVDGLNRLQQLLNR